MVDGSPHILHVIDSLDIGGAQRHLISLAASLQQRGCTCTIATSGRPALHAPEGVTIVSLSRDSISRRVPLRFTASLIRLLAVLPVDIVHAHLHAASLAAAAATAVHRIPLVVTHHSDRSWQPRYHRMLGRWASSRARPAIAVAHSLATDLDANGMPVVTIPNGVRVPERLPLEAERAAMRARLGIAPDALVVSFTGRLVEDKDPLLFVEVAVRVAACIRRAHFLMVGDGPLRGEVERRIAGHGLSHRFTMTGFRTDAAELHGAADVVVLCSRREACPLVALEAMALARPVVGPAIGDLPYLIEDGRTGYVIPRADAPSLSGAVMALADPGRRSRFGMAGREHVVRHCYLDRMVERILDVYTALGLRPELETVSNQRLTQHL